MAGRLPRTVRCQPARGRAVGHHRPAMRLQPAGRALRGTGRDRRGVRRVVASGSVAAARAGHGPGVLNSKAYSSRAIRSPLRRRRRTNAEFTAAGRGHHGGAGGPIRFVRV